MTVNDLIDYLMQVRDDGPDGGETEVLLTADEAPDDGHYIILDFVLHK